VETLKPNAGGKNTRPGRDDREAGLRAKKPWRQICGNVYVQIAAAYAAVILVFILNVIFKFSSYEGRTWFLPFNAYFDPRISWLLLPGRRLSGNNRRQLRARRGPQPTARLGRALRRRRP
jgi:hypothetical protein